VIVVSKLNFIPEKNMKNQLLNSRKPKCRRFKDGRTSNRSLFERRAFHNLPVSFVFQLTSTQTHLAVIDEEQLHLRPGPDGARQPATSGSVTASAQSCLLFARSPLAHNARVLSVMVSRFLIVLVAVVEVFCTWCCFADHCSRGHLSTLRTRALLCHEMIHF